MTFFHGTAAIFSAFDADTRGALTRFPGAEMATFFAADKADASFYAGKSEAALSAAGEPTDRRIIAVEIDTTGLLVADDDMIEIDGEEISIDDDPTLFRAARAAGYAGVHLPGGNTNNAGNTVAIFDLSTVTIKA